MIDVYRFARISKPLAHQKLSRRWALSPGGTGLAASRIRRGGAPVAVGQTDRAAIRYR